MPEETPGKGREARPVRGGSVERKTEQRTSPARPETPKDGKPFKRYAGPRAAHACNGRDRVTGGERVKQTEVKDGSRVLACSVPGVDHGAEKVEAKSIITRLFGAFEGGE